MKTVLLSVLALALCAVSAFAQDVCAPAKVTTLSQTSTGYHTYLLGWTATGDDCTTGNATSYELRRSTSTITDTNWQSATVIASGSSATNGNADCFQSQFFSCPGATTYYYAVFLIDDAGNRSPISNVISAAPRCGAPNQEVLDCP